MLLYQFISSLRRNSEEKKLTIVKNSKEEEEFINELKNRISYIKITNIHNHERLKEVTQEFASIIEKL